MEFFWKHHKQIQAVGVPKRVAMNIHDRFKGFYLSILALPVFEPLTWVKKLPGTAR